MILDQIKKQHCDRWYLYEVLYNRVEYRTHFVIDPFDAIEFLLKRDNPNKAFVLFKWEENKSGMGLFFQKEICIDKYLSLADRLSGMVFDYLI